MMKKTIKLRGILLIMAVLLTISPLSAIGSENRDDADDENPVVVAASSSKIPLSVEFLGKGDTPAAGKVSGSLTDSDLYNEFWLGIAVESVDALKMSELDLFTKGIYSLEMSFAYDSTYIEPYYKSTADVMEAEWNSALVDGNIDSAGSENAWWSGDYGIISVAEANIETNIETENLNLTDLGWKMCVVNIKFSGSNIANARFNGMTSDDDGKKYLLKLPFSLVDVPMSGSPKTFKVILGPEAFNIGSGEGGRETTGLWEKTVSDDSYSNLKNVFEYKGDISLFGDSETITDIIANTAKLTEDSAGTVGEELTLYQDKDSDERIGFEVGQENYYIRVDNEVEEIKLLVKSTNVVQIQDTDAEKETIDGTDYYVKTVAVAELDPKTVGTDGGYISANDIKITSGDKSYTVHIRRLMKPRLEFAPGNSPFGLIERMGLLENEGDRWDAATIAEAKRQFRESDETYGNLTYGELVPNDAQKDFKYTNLAWSKEEHNYDMDETALFVYQSDVFTDPGFTIYDGMGAEVVPKSIKASLNVNILANNTVPLYKSTDNPRMGEPIPIDENGQFDLSGKAIRPEVYWISYKYADDNDIETEVSNKRPIIILSKRGDILLNNSPGINSQDGDNLSSNWAGIKDGNPIFSFRSADINITNAAGINSQDGDDLNVQWGGLSGDSAKQFYNSSILKK